MSYNIFWALQSIASGSAGSTHIGDDNSYSNFTPSAATIKGALSGIDTAIGTFSANFALRTLSNLTSPTAINQDLIFNKANALVKTANSVGAASENISLASGNAPTTFGSGLVASASGSVVDGISGSNSMRTGIASGTGASGNLILATGASISSGSGSILSSTGLVSTSGNSGSISTVTGTAAIGNSGSLTYNSGTSSGGASGVLSFGSGNVIGGLGNSGNISLNSGNSVGGNSGFIILQTGTAAGTRGAIRFVDGSEGVSGYVWTSSDTLGSGFWAPATSSFDPTNIVSNFTVNPAFGDWYLTTGDQAANINTGYVNFYSGNTTGTGMSGNISLQTGSTVNGNSGNITLTAFPPTGTGIQGNAILSVNDVISYAESLQLHRQTTFAPKLLLFDNMDVWSVSLEAPPTLIASIGFVLPDTTGTVGQVLTTDGLGNLSWTSAGSNGWTKYVVNYNSAGLPVASLTNDIELFSLPAKGTIDEIVIHHTTPFSGPGITGYTVSVGIVGNLTKYTSAFNVFQAASNTTFEASLAFNMENFGASTSIRVAAISSGANLDQAAAGSVEIYVRTSTLPA